MLCALTVRHLEPGTFDQFRDAFMAGFPSSDPPPGWVRFHMLRGMDDPDEVVCFGFYDGRREDLEASQERETYAAQQARIAPFVRSVGADGYFEIAESFEVHAATA